MGCTDCHGGCERTLSIETQLVVAIMLRLLVLMELVLLTLKSCTPSNVLLYPGQDRVVSVAMIPCIKA